MFTLQSMLACSDSSLAWERDNTCGEKPMSCSPTSLQGPFTAYLIPSVLYREGSCSSPALKCCSEGDILFLLTVEEDSLL